MLYVMRGRWLHASASLLQHIYHENWQGQSVAAKGFAAEWSAFVGDFLVVLVGALKVVLVRLASVPWGLVGMPFNGHLGILC